MTVLAQFLVVAALALLLAGCGTVPHRNHAGAPDWEDPQSLAPAQVRVQPAPYIAPPPADTSAAPADPPPAVKVPATPPAATWTPLFRWARVTGLASVSNLRAGPVPTYALQSTNTTMVIQGGSPVARLDGLALRLGFPPQVIDGQPYVHGLDLQKTIRPLLAGPAAPVLAGPGPIVLDPGHGGEDAGTHSVLGTHCEKEYTLDLAFRLQAQLAARGWEVLLTRTGDTDMALSNRVAFAERHNAAAFLSLHFNSAAPDHEQAGLETYYLTPPGMPSTLTRGFADNPSQAFPNNDFDTENLLLAVRVHRELLAVNGHHDRGVRRARFPAVLRGQLRPSILLEAAYLSNPGEARMIADPNYRQKLAEAIARAFPRRGAQTAKR